MPEPMHGGVFGTAFDALRTKILGRVEVLYELKDQYGDVPVKEVIRRELEKLGPRYAPYVFPDDFEGTDAGKPAGEEAS